jgi:hypothetical protein
MALLIRERWISMVPHVKFRPTLINTELGEAYTWIELRNQIEQNLTTKQLFDDWDGEAVLSLISPYLDDTEKPSFCDFLETLEVVFEEIRDNDTVIVVEDVCMQQVIIALIEYLYQESYGVKRK